MARWWGLDDGVLRMIRRLPLTTPVRAVDADDDMLRALASCANEAVDAHRRCRRRGWPAALQRVVQRYGRVLDIGLRELQDAIAASAPVSTPQAAVDPPCRVAAGRDAPNRDPAACGRRGVAGCGAHDRPAADGAGRLGRFELLRELGRGAQATVWLAHDPRLEREVALKLLDPEASTPIGHEWLHEARAVSRLTHPNIVPVFEADDAAHGQPYLVFEYVAGPDAGAGPARRGGALPPREAVDADAGRARRAGGGARAGHRAPRPEAVEHAGRRATAGRG